MLSLVCALLCVLALVACNGNKTDKSFQNAEFVQYRKKVTAVLKDNGVFVNDLDEQQSNSAATKSKTASPLAATFPDNSNTIHDIILNAGSEENYAGAKSDRDDIFGQTFYISLILGDAISSYHNENKLYGNVVYFEQWNQYFEVVKNGDIDLLLCYTPATESANESFLTMELDFKSATNYSFTCIQRWSNQSIYCYGNSQKQYFRVSRDFTTDDNYIYYMPDDGEGYYCKSENAVKECYDFVKDTVESVDAAPIKALPSRLKYSVTEEQGTKTLEKYFGNTGPSINEPHGMIYNEIGGFKFGDWYNAFDEKIITIPAECEYLYEGFSIQDNTDSVEKVVIPSTVKGIVSYYNQETGEAYDTPQIIDLDELSKDDFNQLKIWFLHVDCDNYNRSKKLQEITVESGSTYFKEGKGNLYTASGKLLYLADQSLGTTFSVADHDHDMLNNILNEVKEGNYKFLLSDITTLNVTLPFNNPEFMYITENMPKLDTVNLDGTIGNDDWFDWEITVSGNITINIDIESYDRDCWHGPGLFRIVHRNEKDAHIALNIKQICPIPDISSNSSLAKYQTITLPVSKQTYEWIFGETLYEQDFANYVYAQNKGDFILLDTGGGIALTPDFTATELTVPETYYGKEITYIEIDFETIGNKSLRLTVPYGIEIGFQLSGGCIFDNDKFVIVCSENYEDFIRRFDYYYNHEAYDITFTVVCADQTSLVRIGRNNSPYVATVELNGVTTTFKVPKQLGAYDYGVIVLNKKIDFDENLVYFIEDESGALRRLSPEFVYIYDDETGETEQYQYRLSVPLSRDSRYVLYTHEAGVFEYAVENEEYECALTIKINLVAGAEAVEQDAVITSGRVAGYPIFIEDYGIDVPEGDEDNFENILGVRCELFNAFELPIEKDADNIKRIRIKLVLDKYDRLSVVFVDSPYKTVAVTLCDGSTLEYKLTFDEYLPFDATEWKIEDGYAYYIEWHSEDFSGSSVYSEPIRLENGKLHPRGESVILKRVAFFENKPFALSGENYDIAGTLSLTKDSSDYTYKLSYSISGTVEGEALSVNSSTEYFWQTISYKIDMPDIWLGDIYWDEDIYLSLKTAIDEDGNLSVIGFEPLRRLECSYSESLSGVGRLYYWSLYIYGNTANLDYTVYDDGKPAGKYFADALEIREFTESDREGAIVIEDRYNKFYVYLQKTVNPDGSLSFGYVSYTKESNAL